mmetsp:Transcript_21697/g.67682  ORF Transcript_21697/g.67682 Transcript_21697/m.67682 type:complete len:691 (+) Transcript_21697:48-2120(+)
MAAMMPARALLVVAALLALPASGDGLDATVSASLGLDGAGAKNRPVAKVMTLLRDMLNELEQEAKSDEEVYDKLACWCETNDKEKAKSISDAEKKIKGLTNKIDELTATSARLNTEIENLEKEVAENQEALSKATALREKQLEEFSAEEKDLLESISSLKAAVDALSKHNGEGASSLLQVRRDPVRQVADTIRHEMQRHATMLSGVLSHKERRATASFLQSPQEPYAPQSGEIFGILQQMQETFESNLKSTQTEEEENQQEYDELKKAKEAEIAAGQEQLDSKTQDLAATDKENAESKEDLEDTRSQLAADEEFLATLKSKCSRTDKEFEVRQKARQVEMEAVSKAIAVLSSDKSHALFDRTLGTSLLQRRAERRSAGRAHAADLLAAAARRLGSPKLAALAYKVRIDAFKRVKKALDGQIAELVQEKKDEIKHKDFCIEEFQANQLETEAKEHEKEGLLVKVDDLKASITALGKEIQALQREIAEMQLQRKRAGEDREKENAEYQAVVADQRETQQVLKTAMKILSDAYSQTFLVQRQEPASETPPEGFKTYEQNAGGDRAIGMLKTVLADAEAMEAEAVREEEDMQKGYEDFVKDTNAAVDARSREMVDKSEDKATTETELIETEEKRDSALLQLEQLSNYNAQLHSSCDFVMKNFDVRQTARDEEIEALRQAKKILSGDKLAKLLQA